MPDQPLTRSEVEALQRELSLLSEPAVYVRHTLRRTLDAALGAANCQPPQMYSDSLARGRFFGDGIRTGNVGEKTSHFS